MTGEANIAAPGRVRAGVFVVVAALHLLAGLALIRAFAPDLAGRAVAAVVATFDVPATPPSPSPSPVPPPARPAVTAAGSTGTAGKRAVPQARAVPPPRVAIARPVPAPPVAASGAADSAGAREAGPGSGAGAAGSGPGSGGAGAGQGGGNSAVKIAGDINSARDYPIATRDLRIGDRVVVALTVGTDGRPSACRVVRPSRDPQADAITCKLAQARFRFRPATDAAGQPVVSTYGWQQRWFYRGSD